MTTLIIVITVTIGLVGVGVVVWSIFDTRKKHFNEYMERKVK